MQHLHEIIKKHRRMSGLSRAELAKLAGVGKTVVFDLEHGKVSIRYDTLTKILAVLNIRIGFESPLMARIRAESASAETPLRMKKAEVFQQAALAGILKALDGERWRFTYSGGYSGEPVSLTMLLTQSVHEFDRFPPAFEGLLPEGMQLEAMLRRYKLDRTDLFGQLIVAGQDLVGPLTVQEVA